jgi:hypothetical protein
MAKTSRRPAPVAREPKLLVKRAQTGVRMEERLVKVLKAVAELGDMTLGELLEDMALHAFDGGQVFGPKTRRQIDTLKKVYGLDYDVHASYRFAERS